MECSSNEQFRLRIAATHQRHLGASSWIDLLFVRTTRLIEPWSGDVFTDWWNAVVRCWRSVILSEAGQHFLKQRRMIAPRGNSLEGRVNSVGYLFGTQRIDKAFVESPQSSGVHNIPWGSLIGASFGRVAVFAHSPASFGFRVPDWPESSNEMFFSDKLRICRANEATADEIGKPNG